MASVIPASPPPMHLWLLPLQWENDGIAPQLLGAPVAQTIVIEQLETILLSKLEARLCQLRERKLTLAALILVANTLLLSCIWYLLSVWAGK